MTRAWSWPEHTVFLEYSRVELRLAVGVLIPSVAPPTIPGPSIGVVRFF
jgi:hypothetical protein